ncbi:ribosome-binding factor A [Megasphaera cerevisiae DSM 20462]|jgi:ribosome-binding factor A|uniref:Ribosome-binding factor A n=1 Tax=Megasphaera cerevisiae DSM 20462 TaxID=1122219 RepID=A0A0J6WS03_9FIRM|nr:30S ribosome-binding factor RbfA [Megasphaera cerevisiae]KMO86280.1 ribosome-binding factor A [Megasphaera cerevisiae DSM 20462]MCI1751133.1 30S ribosome-binding factor RbfA [Megasphaera cerevisiae]OKY53183.1 ribosome-binding factor A [Megasphaera cerevisiae]SJZ45041.1 ribosome-binding factor A [Megasphaera cerevisiae DSM 20462]
MGELRVRKIQEFIKQEVSSILLRELKDPRVGFITVTDARITGDLREAVVYVSLFGSDTEKKETLQALKSATGYIRTEVGRRLGIRYSPTIEFKEDTSLDYGMKIDKILRDIEKKD